MWSCITIHFSVDFVGDFKIIFHNGFFKILMVKKCLNNVPFHMLSPLCFAPVHIFLSIGVSQNWVQPFL